jgi:hypothetical protein
MEKYSNPTVLNGTAGNSAPVGGRRRKLQLVTKKQARKMLKKLGKKLRGGAPADAVAVAPELAEAAAPASKAGGTRKKRRSASRRASLFGL